MLGRESSFQDVRLAIEILGPIATSRLTYVEVGSALAAARRARRLSRASFERAKAEFAGFWEGLDVIELDRWVADAAVAVGATFALRSHDSIQLASALQDSAGTLVALDVRLRRAALAAGLDVAP